MPFLRAIPPLLKERLSPELYPVLPWATAFKDGCSGFRHTCLQADASLPEKARDPLSSLVAEPLVNWPFCPDNAIFVGFSGSFARSLLSAILGHHHGSIVCLTLLEINNPNSPKILRAPRPPLCRTLRNRPDEHNLSGG